MRIQLITPEPLRFNNGNKITAVRWARILRKLGHRVVIGQNYNGKSCDLLVALHARRSHGSIQKFHALHPHLPLIVVLTGTDLYRDIQTDRDAQRSLDLATRLVVLQKLALAELPERLHSKTRVIYQSAESHKAQTLPAKSFKICVIGHLREEKDPLRTAMAVRRLPATSTIEVLHVGRALDDALAKQAQAEAASNPRYRWVGELPYWMTRRVLARSHLLVITSRMEGSSNVLSEAIASSVPVIVSKIPGLMGTLGKGYPGYFPVGDTAELTRLLLKAESHRPFYRSLQRRCARLASLVHPQREIASWKLLLRELQ
ncbi:MAG TPA: selenoneine biosynthesis selenosugar synthase SenB [Methylomirabilota bacterium]|nr:selenoneine biosynthesis selenosugar synthase SenB [Methylomirabilota bacterium]